MAWSQKEGWRWEGRNPPQMPKHHGNFLFYFRRKQRTLLSDILSLVSRTQAETGLAKCKRINLPFMSEMKLKRTASWGTTWIWDWETQTPSEFKNKLVQWEVKLIKLPWNTFENLILTLITLRKPLFKFIDYFWRNWQNFSHKNCEHFLKNKHLIW